MIDRRKEREAIKALKKRYKSVKARKQNPDQWEKQIGWYVDVYDEENYNWKFYDPGTNKTVVWSYNFNTKRITTSIRKGDNPYF